MPPASPRWDTTACDEAAATRLADALSLPPVVARLLCQRGLSDPELAERFLNPSLDQLHDPMRLADMGVAVERIRDAARRGGGGQLRRPRAELRGGAGGAALPPSDGQRREAGPAAARRHDLRGAAGRRRNINE